MIEKSELNDVIKRINLAKAKGRKIVFTNGCFDVLHVGHVRYLNEAKKLGSRLVVGLNSDASITRLKGKDRPINTFNDRAEVLLGLSSVDWVIPFGDKPSDNDTPLMLILSIMPDILVKGGDYDINTVIGAQEVTETGGMVKIIPFVDGHSTSNIIKQLSRL